MIRYKEILLMTHVQIYMAYDYIIGQIKLFTLVSADGVVSVKIREGVGIESVHVCASKP